MAASGANQERITARVSELRELAKERRTLARSLEDADRSIIQAVKRAQKADVPMTRIAQALGMKRPSVYDLLGKDGKR